MEQIEKRALERLMASLCRGLRRVGFNPGVDPGIYGVMAYSVTRRTNEIGIRMALGARPTGLAWMVLRETLLLAVAGIVIGVPAILTLSPILNHALAPAYRESFAYGMQPNDPMTIALAVLILAAVGVWPDISPPGVQRVDPMTALRHD